MGALSGVQHTPDGAAWLHSRPEVTMIV